MRLTLLTATTLSIGAFFSGTALYASQLGSFIGGVEDGGAPQIEGQGDFNDMIFNMTGQGLTLLSNGQWNSYPAVSNPGSVFWNNTSADGPGMGIGYCIYGGGNCNIPAAPPPTPYLSTPTGGQVTDILFFDNAGTPIAVSLLGKFTAYYSTLEIGWYDPNNPTVLHTIFAGNMAPGTALTFTPSTVFGLWIENGAGAPVFYSNTSLGADPNLTHFAFFDPGAIPEPGTLALIPAGLLFLGFGYFRNRRKGAALQQQVVSESGSH